MNTHKSSRIPEFYKHTPEKRLEIISNWAQLNEQEQEIILGKNSLNIEQANNMIENCIGLHTLPIGVATNFTINHKDYLIPMTIEEPSVIAAVSNAAKLFRQAGGFNTSSDESIAIGQIQVLDISSITSATETILTQKDKLIEQANRLGGSILKRGGGTKDIQVRHLDSPIGPMIIVHILFDTKDAMGANIINTVVEDLAPTIEQITNGRTNLRILSNLTDQRKARAEGIIPAKALSPAEEDGQIIIKRIIEANTFAEVDPYRATTHNKGIMNGIDAVLIATGNDWRAVEAGAHAYAARDGSYTSLTKWWQDDNGDLRGAIELPLAVGIVGGATRVHPTAKVALKILGVESARELSEVIAAVGLAQNFAAMRALVTEGIQHGHMRLHARQIAVAAGAPDTLVTQIAQQMIAENNIRLERATELVNKLMQGNQEHDN